MELGEIEIQDNVSEEKLKMLDNNLRAFGLELKEDKKNVLVEKIKSAIIELVHESDEQTKVSLCDYLSRKLNYNCTYLSNLFSEKQGTSLEKYFYYQ